ncbi:NAD(P)-dependent oxidoreductase [Schaalia vaccimaxillae]|uniref:NAD(P)-dependent oxidoreductase n=1 Tax=Schaalia vaccimaxillae TaxID=183916 RepID=UPI0003B37C38|nr:NAD(P)H-binding protein [Schaalia vaccimaxillae]
MKITVIGGTGATGSAAVTEAARRGHEVVSVSRSAKHAAGATVDARADLADTRAIVDLVNGSDVTIIAVPTDRTGGPTRPIIEAFEHLFAARPVGRMIVVGGAGSLLDEEGNRLVDSPNFPEDYRPEGLAFAKILDLLREAGDKLAWTFVSPSPNYPVEESSGAYVEAADSAAGENLSAADLAIALIDEAEKDAHRGKRFTVASA